MNASENHHKSMETNKCNLLKVLTVISAGDYKCMDLILVCMHVYYKTGSGSCLIKEYEFVRSRAHSLRVVMSISFCLLTNVSLGFV